MIDLWQLLRVTWLVTLPPEQPAGVGIRKVTARRGEVLDIHPEQLAVVLSGVVVDRAVGADGTVATIRRYTEREPILLPVGELWVGCGARLLVLMDGWQSVLPEAAAVVQMLIAAEVLDTKRRLASVMTETPAQRIRAHLLAEGIEPKDASPSEVARYVMCSRGRASQVINQMRRGVA